MTWTVPANCYYGIVGSNGIATYYGAGSTVPTDKSPNNSAVTPYSFALVDFNNGYIYTGLKNRTLTFTNSNTFTITPNNPPGGYSVLNIIASNDAVSDHNLTLAGSAFTFGNGSGMLNKADFLPSSAEYMMKYTFAGRSVTNVTIPTGVNRLQNTFEGCTSLTTAPVIPNGVTNTTSCFYDCTALSGQVTINGSPTKYDDMFAGTVNELVITGSGSINTTIASQYANVYAWSLSSSIAAQRDESVLTSVDISVDVTRFNTGTLTSLSLYENGGQTPLSVTWNDPTLTITGNPTTFTTTITGIAEGDTPTISVIATDAYGSAIEVSVNVPIAFYTMDVQAGGKEIAFGAIATDNLTSHPDGLFRCNMDALLVGTTTEVENPYYSLDTTASPGTTDGDLYAAITALSWQSDVIV